MEGRRCRDVVWERNGLQVLERGGSPDHQERRVRGREKAADRGFHKENTSPKSLTEIIMRFYNQRSSKIAVLEVCTTAIVL